MLHIINTPGQASSGCHRWSCKFCNFTLTSSITRVVRHLTGIDCTNNCGASTKVPKAVKEMLIAENFLAMVAAGKVKGSQKTQDTLQDAFLGEYGDSSTHTDEGFVSQSVAGEQPSVSRKRARVIQEDDDAADVHMHA